jgi:hypothetical protein
MLRQTLTHYLIATTLRTIHHLPKRKTFQTIRIYKKKAHIHSILINRDSPQMEETVTSLWAEILTHALFYLRHCNLYLPHQVHSF